jgi:hypothetical protein
MIDPDFFKSIPPFRLLTHEEMYTSCKPGYDRVAKFMIDHWPQSVKDLSFPTKLVEIEGPDARLLFDYQSPDWKSNATKIAQRLDDEMDWNSYFIRLNSRSPKDVSDNLITCAARQAVSWISQSERCLDDVTVAFYSKNPIYIALREPHRLHKDGEFRCFAKDGETIAVSRYFYHDKPVFIPDPGVILNKARDFYRQHLKDYYPDVVFDLYIMANDVKLIEINPYGLSDPCAFGTYEDVEKGGERLHPIASSI